MIFLLSPNAAQGINKKKKMSIKFYRVSREHHHCLIRKFAYYCHLVKKTVEAQGANSGYNSVFRQWVES